MFVHLATQISASFIASYKRSLDCRYLIVVLSTVRIFCTQWNGSILWPCYTVHWWHHRSWIFRDVGVSICVMHFCYFNYVLRWLCVHTDIVFGCCNYWFSGRGLQSFNNSCREFKWYCRHKWSNGFVNYCHTKKPKHEKVCSSKVFKYWLLS